MTGTVRTCPNCGVVLPPGRPGNWPDLLALLALCRDALDKGYPDLVRAVLHVIVEHDQDQGRRARDLARRLAEQLAQREGGLGAV